MGGRKDCLLDDDGALLRVRVKFYLLTLPHNASMRLCLHTLAGMWRLRATRRWRSEMGMGATRPTARVFRGTIATVCDYRSVVRVALTISETRWIVAARTGGRWWRRAARVLHVSGRRSGGGFRIPETPVLRTR
jgi:hypothetical protein